MLQAYVKDTVDVSKVGARIASAVARTTCSSAKNRLEQRTDEHFGNAVILQEDAVTTLGDLLGYTAMKRLAAEVSECGWENSRDVKLCLDTVQSGVAQLMANRLETLERMIADYARRLRIADHGFRKKRFPTFTVSTTWDDVSDVRPLTSIGSRSAVAFTLELRVAPVVNLFLEPMGSAASLAKNIWNGSHAKKGGRFPPYCVSQQDRVCNHSTRTHGERDMRGHG